jgi:2-haloacid dehalogenase/putative hydrolase of the HAD superfamily
MTGEVTARGAAVRALLLDFYGTLVEEDTEVVADVARRIAETSPRSPTSAEVASHWGRRFAALCAGAHGSHFATQRALERASLVEVLERWQSPLDPDELSARLFDYWAAPRAIDGTAEFIAALRVPACVVSNIDSDDLAAALASHGWSFAQIVTSEASRAYKPRAEMFQAALEKLGCAPGEVLHVGDSLHSDVRGATALGIPVAWVNPRRRPLPSDVAPPRHVVSRVSELAPVLR